MRPNKLNQPLPSLDKAFRIAGLSILVSALACGAGYGQVQDYPNKPIRIVTYEAGGGGDSVARLIAQGVGVGLGQQIDVDNRGGASGMVAVRGAKRNRARYERPSCRFAS